MILLENAAPGHDLERRLLYLQQQSEQVHPPAPEAVLVVDERHGDAVYFSRNALIRTSYCWASREYTPYASAWMSDSSAVCERTNAGVFDE